ncbi:hypothetical protein OG21DRAFT_1479754 [Imleria badia]|nr:hypothetical protein OG21DRAFT_1479754 [Imleria badia]
MATRTAQLTLASAPREEMAHNDLRHKGVFTVRTRLLLRFWWPMLVDNVKWFIQTCHECQICQTQCFHIPPTVPAIGGLFRKVHIDTMLMPRSGSYWYIVQAYVLADRYNICHIRISPYNLQVNGVVEQHHYNVREAIVKSSLGGESRWYSVAHSVFWAERVMILRSTVKPLFPFDFSEATFLVPPPDTDRISSERVLKACFESVKHFEATFKNQIKDFDFHHGSLVLELNQKTKPRYLGPMVVLRWTTGGLYILAELDGAVSKLRYAAFHLLPYYPHFQTDIPVTELTGLGDEDLDKLAGADIEEPDNEDLE